MRYKEKYEKEKGKAMLDFETPTYVTAKEAQHMQSQVNTLSVSSDFNAIHFSLSLSLKTLYSLLYISMYCNASCYMLICFISLDVELLFILDL